MEKEKIGVATRLFINGQQVGSDSHYMDYYPSFDMAISDTRAFFEGDGYQIDSIELEHLPRWSGTEPVPTLVVHLHK